MQTIVGPIKGVLKVDPPELYVGAVQGGCTLMLSQWVREEAGWDRLMIPTDDTTVYETREAALVAMEKLR